MRYLFVLLIVALPCITGCGEKSEFDKGVDAGRDWARSNREHEGEVKSQVFKYAIPLSNKLDESHSAEWNNGLKSGYRKELDGTK